MIVVNLYTCFKQIVPCNGLKAVVEIDVAIYALIIENGGRAESGLSRLPSCILKVCQF